MKRFICALLVLILALSSISALAEVNCSEWAKEDIERARVYKWISDGDFTKNITREEFCVIAKKMLDFVGFEVYFEPIAEKPFNDTDSYEVAYLYWLGIVKGKSENEFKPRDYLTREEAAVIIKRIIDWLSEYKVADVTTNEEEDFLYRDYKEISSWATEAVYDVRDLGIVMGTGAYFEPKTKLTYEEAVILLMRLYNKIEVTESTMFSDKLNSLMPRDKNYMFSPLSIKMALGLAANGAEGETEKEILDALGIDSIDTFNEFSKDLIEKYSVSDKIRFDVANSIWINRSNTKQNFKKEYKDIVKEYYNAESGEVENRDAVKVINNWVKDKTNGKIQGIIDDNNFWAILVNAIYFKGMWDDEFYKGATEPDIFHSADGEEKEIDFMNKTDWIKYHDTGKSKIISLPYKTSFYYLDENGEEQEERNNDLSASMYIIMADVKINVEEELNKADGSYKRTYINLSMPKFEVENSIQMGKILGEMGIQKAFSQNAEFTKMFDEGNMFISDVLHKTYIKVDEEGTEAAAITAIPMAGSALPPEPIDFKVNKPFYFAVKVSDEILFMGRYAYAK